MTGIKDIKDIKIGDYVLVTGKQFEGKVVDCDAKGVQVQLADDKKPWFDYDSGFSFEKIEEPIIVGDIFIRGGVAFNVRPNQFHALKDIETLYGYAYDTGERTYISAFPSTAEQWVVRNGKKVA